MVAKWVDERPMIAIRHDQPALVTSLAFVVGEQAGLTGSTEVLVNAICLEKN